MNKQQLAATIWESANKMRSKIEANEYKDYILGFIFYKYLSDKEVKFLVDNQFPQERIETLDENETETIEYIKDNIGYFIPYKNLFSTWISMKKDFDVSNVRDALSAFNRLINPKFKKVFEGIFETLQTGLSKLGTSAAAQTKAISELIHLIKDIPMDGKQDYDVLGYIYEYLISMFAANAGKKAGEFYTPHEVSVLMSEIIADHLKDRKEIKIYDPTSGSGSLLINIGNSISKHINNPNSIKYYAQELKENTYNLTRMNLIMRGIIPDNITVRNGDTLEDDWPYFDDTNPIETYDPLYVDAVVSNPPYSQAWDSSNKNEDLRYKGFGIAPKSKADYAFLLHDLYHIKPDGLMAIVLPHGVLFRGGEEGQIRKNLIEKNHIDTIIGLPANLFFGTGIPTIIMILKQKRDNSDTLIIDASKGFTKEGKNNVLRASDIKKIVDTVVERKTISKYSKLVSKEEIRENEYNLNIPRYVDSSEPTEQWDLYASMFGGIPNKELDELNSFWKAFPTLKESLFNKDAEAYYQLNTDKISDTIHSNNSVKDFINNFNSEFDNLGSFIKHELIDDISKVNRAMTKDVLCSNIFNRLDSVDLIDKYDAYQILDDEWKKISIDIEMIQTEGTAVIKKVDPKFIQKKKSGKTEEVQDGWQGHILPFELIQNTILIDEKNKIIVKEDRLAEISSEYQEILDSLSEDDKESNILNDDKTAFVNKIITKEAKSIKSDIKKGIEFEEDSIETKILQVEKLINEEKELKAQIKKETVYLEKLTKTTIENLSEEQITNLLEEKWINPIIKGLKELPIYLINQLTDKVKKLSEKYSTNFFDIEKEIEETEQELSSLIDDLTGNEYDMKALKAFQEMIKGN
ncbi:MAG: type I restriction-modification system subunit M [Sphaerochaetaceae bacterium]|nr:type I restriction-modification system subunit M [Sphaerochaetaceae bacterium]